MTTFSQALIPNNHKHNHAPVSAARVAEDHEQMVLRLRREMREFEMRSASSRGSNYEDRLWMESMRLGLEMLERLKRAMNAPT